MALSQATANGHVSSPLPDQSPSVEASSRTDIFNASSVAEIKAALSRLHNQEAAVTARLDALVTSQKDLSRELGRLDLMRANIGTQTSTTRSISHGMLSGAAGTAERISSAVRRLDLEQARVKATLEVVEQVAELKACALGVAGSMGASQDWETAASYLHRAAQVPPSVVNGPFAAEMVPTAEVPDAPSVTLDNAAESLCGLFLREFDKAVKESDGAKITRFFKLFPLIGRSEVGLDVYGRYVCQGVAARARGNLNASTGAHKDGFFYANALTKLFEHIAQIIDGHGGLVERHYGPRKMGRVIERLQVEADVQGGIILDTWSDERHVDRKLMDIKSYAFTFLVQSFLPAQRTGPARTQSPAPGANAVTEDEGVDMKEIDGILNEMAIMLGRWSLYCRFLADTCNVSIPLCLHPMTNTYTNTGPFKRGNRRRRQQIHSAQFLARGTSDAEDQRPPSISIQRHDNILLPSISREGLPTGRVPCRPKSEPPNTSTSRPTAHHLRRRRHNVHRQQSDPTIPRHLPRISGNQRRPNPLPRPRLRLHRHDPTQNARRMLPPRSRPRRPTPRTNNLRLPSPNQQPRHWSRLHPPHRPKQHRRKTTPHTRHQPPYHRPPPRPLPCSRVRPPRRTSPALPRLLLRVQSVRPPFRRNPSHLQQRNQTSTPSHSRRRLP